MLDLSIVNALQVGFVAIIVNLVVAFLGINNNKNNIIRFVPILIYCGMVFISINVIGVVFKTGPIAIEVFKWIHIENLNLTFTLLVDELSAVLLLLISTIGVLVALHYAIIREGRYQNELLCFSMMMLCMFVVAIAGNFVTFLTAFIICGYIFNQIYINDSNERKIEIPLYLPVIYRISNIIMLVGVLGIYSAFQTGSFVDFKEKDVMTTLVMKNEVIIYSVLVVLSLLTRWLQFPLTHYLCDLNQKNFSVSMVAAWFMQLLIGVVLLGRLAVIFVSLVSVMKVFIWLLIISFGAFTGLALVQQKPGKVMGYLFSSISCMILIMCFLGQFDDAVVYIGSAVIGYSLLSKFVEMSYEAKTSERKIFQPPVSIIIVAVIALMLTLSFAGVPSYFSIIELVMAASDTVGIVGSAIVVIFWMLMGIGISKIIIKTIVTITPKDWNGIYDRKIKLFFWVASIMAILLTVLKYIKFGYYSQTSMNSFINRSVLSVDLSNEYSIPTVLVIGLLGLVAPILVYYLYIIKLEENFPKKFEDSFPAINISFKKDLYMKEVERLLFHIIPRKIMVSCIMLFNVYIPKGIGFVKRSLIAVGVGVLSMGEVKKLDGVLAMIWGGAVVILAIAIGRYVF